MIPTNVTEDSISVSVWFACKICSQCFQNVENFLKHKQEVHLEEFQKFICIVFEEKTTITNNNLGYNIPDANSLPPATDSKQEQLLLSSDDQNLDLKPVIYNDKVTEAGTDDSICQVQNETIRKPPQNLYVLLKRLTPNASAEYQNSLPPATDYKQDHILSSDNEHLDLEQGIYTDDATEADTDGSICQVQNEPRNFQQNPYVFLQRLTSKEIQQYNKCQTQALPPNHLTVLSKSKAHKCPLTHCQKVYKTRAILLEHVKRHTHCRPIKCTGEGCKKSFKTQTCLLQHLKVHTQGRPFKCVHTNCGKFFKTRKYWRLHCAFHTREKRFKCQQPNCRKIFSAPNLLRSHSKTHSDEKVFKCPHANCEKAYCFRSSLKGHLETHTKEKQFKCQEPTCGKAFKREKHLRDHLKIHSDSRPCFHCPYSNCGKVSPTKRGLKRHWALLHAQDSSDSGEKLFELKKCDRTGCLPNSYQRILDKGPLKCPQTNCTKEFKYESKLRDHLARHSNLRSHKCSVPNCGKAFKYPGALKRHLKTHTTET